VLSSRWLPLLTLGAILAPALSSGAEILPDGIDPECLRYIRENCMPQWKAAQEAQANIEVTCEDSSLATWTSERGEKQEQRQAMKWTLCWNKRTRQFLVSRTWLGGGEGITGSRSDIVFNPEYHFSAWRERSADQFILGDAQSVRHEDEWTAAFGQINPRFRNAISASYSPYSVDLHDLFERSYFELLRAGFLRDSPPDAPGERTSESSIFIEARHVGGKAGLRNGEVWNVTLRSENSWLVSRVEVRHHTEPEEIWLTIDYGTRRFEDVPFPVRIEYHKRQTRLDYRLERTCLFDQPQKLERKPEEFLVTAYGLPENVIPPPLDARTRSPNPILLINLGIIGILLSIWLGRWALRLRQNPLKASEGQRNTAAGN
jgi:hypothetical protein